MSAPLVGQWYVRENDELHRALEVVWVGKEWAVMQSGRRADTFAYSFKELAEDFLMIEPAS